MLEPTTPPQLRQGIPRPRLLVLVGAFVLTHAWLSWSNFYAPGVPMADVTRVYRGWVFDGLHGHGWVGIDSVWVYPSAALVPMLFAAMAGYHAYPGLWLGLITVLNGLAVIAIVRASNRTREAFFWLAFMALLGPIAAGRIDAVSVPLAIIGGVLVARRPALGSALMTLGAWVKVWPGALVVAALVALPRRGRQIAGAALTCIVVVGTALAFGSHYVTGFFADQTGRGLQLESVVTTPWLWAAHFHMGPTIYWDGPLQTFNVIGPKTWGAAQLATPLMAAVVLAICGLGFVALRRGVPAVAVFTPLALSLTANMIATNKVGSPQYISWLAAPIILGLAAERFGGPSFTVPAVIALVIAPLTQIIYPWHYGGLTHVHLDMLITITIRNGGVALLMFFGAYQLIVQARRAKGSTVATSPASMASRPSTVTR